jgi:hypothetical protein
VRSGSLGWVGASVGGDSGTSVVGEGVRGRVSGELDAVDEPVSGLTCGLVGSYG